MQKQKYHYKAAASSGEVVTGELTATSDQAVASLLQQRGMVPLRIQVASPASGPGTLPAQSKAPPGAKKVKQSLPGTLRLAKYSFRFSRSTANTRDLTMFSQDLSALLEAGVPLPRSLKIIGELVEKKRFEAVILDLHERIKEGSTFWEALEKHPKVFSPVFVNMVKAGEAGGVLDTVLARLADFVDSIPELKEYLVSATIYPLVLMVTAVGSVAVLLTVVVPKFATIFSDIGVALPLATQIMLSVGTFLQSYGWLLVLVMLAIFLSIRFYISTVPGRHAIDRLKIGLPVVGKLMKKIEISRFCRTFGTLLSSGVPILSALQMVRGVLANVILNAAIEDVHLQLKEGKSLSESLARTGLFPTMAVQMIAIGEETGRMDNMLIRVSDIYEREIKVSIKAFTSLFEPLVVLLMGLVIGAMVISMLMAIFSVNDLGF